MGKYFKRAWVIYKNYPAAVLPGLILSLLVLLLSFSAMPDVYALDYMNETQAVAFAGGVFLMMFLVLIVSWLLGALANSFSMGIIKRGMSALEGERASLEGALGEGAKKFFGKNVVFSLLWVLVEIGIAIVLILLFVVVIFASMLSYIPQMAQADYGAMGQMVLAMIGPILILAVICIGGYLLIYPAYMLGMPAIALGNKSGASAFGDGWRSLRGRYGKSILIVLMQFGVAFVIAIITAIVASLAISPDQLTAYYIFSGVLSLISYALIFYFQLMFYAMYEDVLAERRAKEFNAEPGTKIEDSAEAGVGFPDALEAAADDTGDETEIETELKAGEETSSVTDIAEDDGKDDEDNDDEDNDGE